VVEEIDVDQAKLLLQGGHGLSRAYEGDCREVVDAFWFGEG
jgi:hypothetical protein